MKRKTLNFKGEREGGYIKGGESRVLFIIKLSRERGYGGERCNLPLLF